MGLRIISNRTANIISAAWAGLPWLKGKPYAVGAARAAERIAKAAKSRIVTFTPNITIHGGSASQVIPYDYPCLTGMEGITLHIAESPSAKALKLLFTGISCNDRDTILRAFKNGLICSVSGLSVPESQKQAIPAFVQKKYETLKIREPVSTEALRKIKKSLKGGCFNCDVRSIDYYEFRKDQEGGERRYTDVKNTYQFRRELFLRALLGEPLKPHTTDYKFLKGEIKEPIIMGDLDLPSLLKYGKFLDIEERLGAIAGIRSFMAIPIYEKDNEELVGVIGIGFGNKNIKNKLGDKWEKVLENVRSKVSEGTNLEKDPIPFLETGRVSDIYQNIIKASPRGIKKAMRAAPALGNFIMYFEEIVNQLNEMQKAHLKTILAIIDMRKPDLRWHCSVVSKISRLIGERLSTAFWAEHFKKRNKNLGPGTVEFERERLIGIEKLAWAACVHDVEQMSLDDLYLQGKARRENFRKSKKHLFEIKFLDEWSDDNPMKSDVADVVQYHHEDLDGTGPHKKTGKDIPDFARIVRIADTIHAILRKDNNGGKSPIYALTQLIKGYGSEFDPEFTEAALGLFNDKKMPLEERLIAIIEDHSSSLGDQASCIILNSYVERLKKHEMTADELFAHINSEQASLPSGVTEAFKKTKIEYEQILESASICANIYLKLLKTFSKRNMSETIGRRADDKNNYKQSVPVTFIDNLLVLWFSHVLGIENVAAIDGALEERRKNDKYVSSSNVMAESFFKLPDEGKLARILDQDIEEYFGPALVKTGNELKSKDPKALECFELFKDELMDPDTGKHDE